MDFYEKLITYCFKCEKVQMGGLKFKNVSIFTMRGNVWKLDELWILR